MTTALAEEASMAPVDLVDWATFKRSPGITPERWASIFPKWAEYEKRI